MHYILDENCEVKEVTLYERAEWFESASRTVKQDHCIDSEGNKYFVSTVFLGLDHSFGRGDPQLFETMIIFEREIG